MKIERVLCFPDVHGEISSFIKAFRKFETWDPTLLLFVGDFSPSTERLANIIDDIGIKTFSVPGNHDDLNNFVGTNIDRKKTIHNGLRFYGIGGSGPQKFGFPYEWTEEELCKINIPKWDVLLTHTPPYNTKLDQLQNGDHVGSSTIKKIAEQNAGILISGHIHESVGFEILNNCLCYNTGSLASPNGRIQVGKLKIEQTRNTIDYNLTHYELSGKKWVKLFSVNHSVYKS